MGSYMLAIAALCQARNYVEQRMKCQEEIAICVKTKVEDQKIRAQPEWALLLCVSEGKLKK